MNVSQGPQVSSESPAPLALGECHKLCRPDPDEMKATWILTHPGRAARILRITGLDGKFQFLSRGHKAATRGPPRNQVQAEIPLDVGNSCLMGQLNPSFSKL